MTAAEGGVPGVQGGAVGGVSVNTYTGTARNHLGGSGVTLSPPPPPGEAQTYRVSLPKAITCLRCPVAGLQWGAPRCTNLQVQFAHHHVKDSIVILEEGNRPYPHYPKCDIFVYQQ